MAHVMEERSQTHQPPCVLIRQQFRADPAGDVQRADGMIEPRVNSTGINKRLQCQLAKAPETLKYSSIDNALFERFPIDEPVDRISQL